MKRILITQKEQNDGEDCVIINGKIISDKDLQLKSYRIIKETNNWRQKYKDELLQIKSNNKSILLKSHYLDKDNMNRNIFYLYYIENNDNLNLVLKYLEKDSKVIDKKIDKAAIKEVINKIKVNKKLEEVFIKVILVIIAAAITYSIIKFIKN